jgi:hypothetical protein
MVFGVISIILMVEIQRDQLVSLNTMAQMLAEFNTMLLIPISFSLGLNSLENN